MLESTLIGALTGFGGSLFNGIIGYFQLKEKNKHEVSKWAHDLALLEKQTDADIRKHEAKAVDEEHARLLDHDKAINGVRAWVRPILTYVFVGIYLLEVGLVLSGHFPFGLTGEQASVINGFNLVVSAILAYWFGSRSIEKMQIIMK